MADQFNPGREQVHVTAAPTLVAERAANDPAGSVNRLIQALGADSTQRELNRFNQEHEARKLAEQQTKFDWYVEQFRADGASGAVSEAQVKSRFPEAVPIIASRIAEAIGQKEGRKQFQAVVDEIAGNDALRLDTAQRDAFIAKKRQELTATVGTGNDFYGAGFVSAIDKALSQHEYNWQSETAAYHSKVQAEQFTGEVADILTSSDDPKAALLGLDGRYAASSSLNPLERNKLVVGAAIDQAFASDKPEMLSQVPTRFLNADSKAALEKAKLQIQDRRMTNYRMGKELEKDRRDTEERNGRIAITEAAANGTPVDPAEYRSNPQLYQAALEARELPRVPAAESAGNVQKFETRVWADATSGHQRSQQEYVDAIIADKSINPKDKAPLIARLEKLMEGTMVMQDDLVKQTFSTRVDPSIDFLERSVLGPMFAAQGRNVREEINRRFEQDLRLSWQSHYEDTGAFPRGRAKQELIDRAMDRATAYIDKLMNPKGPKNGKSSAPESKPDPTAKSGVTLRPGVTLVN